MTTEQTKEIVRRYVDRVWNSCDFDAIDSLTTSEFAYRLSGQPPRERAAMKEFLAATHAAFPDWLVRIDQMIAEGDRVAVQWSGTVTHEGAFHGIPPTGRKISVSGINIYEMKDGKVAAEWEQTDSLGMLQQLGAFKRT